MILDTILKFIPKGKTLNNELYTKPDEIYSIWVLGYNLGALLSYIHTGTINPQFCDTLSKFIINYEKVKVGFSIILKENTVIKELLDEINSQDGEIENQDIIREKIFRIFDFLAFDIATYSSHLANLFCFGFGLNKLRSVLLYPHSEIHIKQEMDSLLESIRSIEKGDKKLESPNLEISATNLKIITLSLRIMKNKTEKLLNNANESNFAHIEFINSFYFKFVTDIILDIKNPINLITNKLKWLLFIIYYYVIVMYIFVIYNGYILVQQYAPKLIDSFKNFDFKESDIFVSIVLPIFVFGLYISFRRISNWIVKMFIGYQIEHKLNKIRKEITLT